MRTSLGLLAIPLGAILFASCGDDSSSTSGTTAEFTEISCSSDTSGDIAQSSGDNANSSNVSSSSSKNQDILDTSLGKPGTRYVTDTIYRIKNCVGNIEEWLSSQCDIKKDSTFTCTRYSQCQEMEWGNGDIRCVSDRWNVVRCDSLSGGVAIPTVRDTAYVELNYGDHPVVNYIPCAEIPEFNADSVKQLFAELSGDGCNILQTYSSNYELDAIGLPDSLEWYLQEDYRLNRYRNNGEYAGLEKTPQGCSFWQLTENVSIVANPCYRFPLPENLWRTTYKLVNLTLATFQDTTIQWKLVYKDQYGRGDTLEMKTHFTKSK